MLIDFEYFIRDIFIAQRSQLAVREQIDLYIGVEEPKYLEKVLGKDLYEDFKIGLEQDPIDPQWGDLRNILVNPDTKVSPIANFVYCQLMEDAITETTGIGEVLPHGENSTKASPVTKITWAWNKMINMTCENHKEIKALDLPGYSYQDREDLCPPRTDWICGCKVDPIFEYRNRFGW